MEISESTKGVFYLNRVMGLAPYSLQKNFSNGQAEIKRSLFLSVYSFLLIVTLVFLTYWGLLFDANSKIPIRASFRMKSDTSKVVTTMDVSVVVFATFTGVICGLIGLGPTQDLNRRLTEVDEILYSYTNVIKDRFRTYILMSPMLFLITFMLGLDVWTWHRRFGEMRVEHQRSDEPEPEEELNVQWYIPFYSLYYILTALHINFAQSAVGLGRRYRRLNIALRSAFNRKADLNPNCDGVIPTTVTKIATIKKSMDLLSTTIQKGQKKVSQSFSSFINAPTKSAIIDRLAYTHCSLGRCMDNISKAFGFTVMFMLISCLLHLVATAYFLFLEFLGNKDVGFSWLQFLWIVFHIIRLLLIVEPCHVTAQEAKHTMLLICEMQLKCNNDDDTSKSIRKFWRQLLSESPSFSAFGMSKINRQILTSFSSAITTYLVILIQFQQSTNGSSSEEQKQHRKTHHDS